jgi:hypothetical protein
MIDYSMIYVYGLLTLFFSVDVSLKMLANPTHIRSKWVIHRNQTFEEVVWKRPCHSLLALPL